MVMHRRQELLRREQTQRPITQHTLVVPLELEIQELLETQERLETLVKLVRLLF
jgi:hypothetical protein